ncbi:LytR C-terminal domain-containing protein, partial [Streptomyces bacillaris]|uniref:LytR C-terminal domain-containing protein n=1 Tax=Streptomyces bacillaris TaxID=68179 RepID=UPI0036691A52
YTVVGTGNAPDPAERTAVLHAPGMADHARVLISRLDGVAADPDEQSAGEVLTLVIGPDYPGAA